MDSREVLLHVCCAPDATVPIPELAREGYRVTCYFYGSNIHPIEEYERRLDAALKIAREFGVELITDDYNPALWASEIKGLEDEPEGGRRCARCFRMQLEGAAAAAGDSRRYLCTTLTISPHKDPTLINKTGLSAAESAGATWLHRIWRKDDGFKRSVAESVRMGLYRQSYCGCVYSMNRGTRDERGR